MHGNYERCIYAFFLREPFYRPRTPQHDAKAARVAMPDYFGATKAPRLNDNRTFQDAWYTR